jgi:hypothetical protein
MKNLNHLPLVIRIVFLVACFNVFVLAQSTVDRNQFAAVSSFGSSVRFDVSVPRAAVTLTVIGPDGLSFSKEFKGNFAEFTLITDKGERLPDGQYTYELRVTPNISADVKEALKAAREKGNGEEVQREMRKRGALPPELVQSGGFLVINGTAIVAGATEGKGGQARAMVEQPGPAPAPAVVSTGRVAYKVQRNHPRFLVFDQVIADDLIVQGSICAGLDCANGENFGFDTFRLKENNTRIQFDDDSTSAGFPNNNWQIRANDSGSGGSNFLGFVDQGVSGNSETGTLVFAVNAGASANSLRVGSNSKVGLRTATPVLDVHANTTDTPAIRLEQNNSGGFTAQTWDIAGNEANFFVRDVTGGSRLPFRIRPGAPTSSIDIAASGNVGIGTASPVKKLHIFDANSQVFVDRPANVAGNYALINFATNGAQKFFFGLNSDSDPGADRLSFFDQAFSAATAVMTFTGGNVGIGTSAPTDKLSVNGTASKPGGGTWAVFSDERLKMIKGNFNSGLSAVMKLQPLRYEYKPDNALGIKSEGEHIGFGAQAVQKVIPEAVTMNSSGYLMVNNDPIIWTMLNAIKEQQKEIVELKRQIRQLRSTARRRR